METNKEKTRWKLEIIGTQDGIRVIANVPNRTESIRDICVAFKADKNLATLMISAVNAFLELKENDDLDLLPNTFILRDN